MVASEEEQMKEGDRERERERERERFADPDGVLDPQPPVSSPSSLAKLLCGGPGAKKSAARLSRLACRTNPNDIPNGIRMSYLRMYVLQGGGGLPKVTSNLEIGTSNGTSIGLPWLTKWRP